jgi:hypothetical protein
MKLGLTLTSYLIIEEIIQTENITYLEYKKSPSKI